ncbi:MAG TPA: phosphotransferase family protein [Steroidobacteraceae bacterium]|nr:phosphotransferase family protein [Steroidobacteraceae bacterium]
MSRSSADTAAATALCAARSDLLARALMAGCSSPVEVQSMQLAAGGNSRETWTAEVRIGATARRVVLRCDPDHWIRPVEMQREINGLRLAAQSGVPVPETVVSSQTVELERPYVVTAFVEGTAIARQILREPGFSMAREKFARQCGEILGKLHGSSASRAGWDEYDPIAELEWHLSNTDFPSPVLEGALRWLERHRPAPASPPVPVHRDFRLGNLMVQPEGIAAVLDWETCRLGDPAEDLAWLCTRSWRYGSQMPVGGIGSLHDLLDAYQAAGGMCIERQSLHWWSVYAETRWGLAGMARQRQASAGDRMEQAAIARRACRQELNVLLELKSGGLEA